MTYIKHHMTSMSDYMSHTQFQEHAAHEKRGVSSLEELIQAFKIAERAAPGFCDTLIQRTVTYLRCHPSQQLLTPQAHQSHTFTIPHLTHNNSTSSQPHTKWSIHLFVARHILTDENSCLLVIKFNYCLFFFLWKNILQNVRVVCVCVMCDCEECMCNVWRV